MANVRIDENGVPKGPAYDVTTPQAHRSNITAVDATDPADASGGVDCAGYEYCRFDITITGTGFTSLDVQVLFWNSRQGLWCLEAIHSYWPIRPGCARCTRVHHLSQGDRFLRYIL